LSAGFGSGKSQIKIGPEAASGGEDAVPRQRFEPADLQFSFANS
jgi:hypothetical protein